MNVEAKNPHSSAAMAAVISLSETAGKYIGYELAFVRQWMSALRTIS